MIVTKNKITCRRRLVIPVAKYSCQMKYSIDPPASVYHTDCYNTADYVYGVYISGELYITVPLCLECAEVMEAMELDGWS